MSDLPVETGTDSIDARPRASGRRAFDLTIATVAIVISLISLAVGFYNAQSQQRMVAAESWPFLVYGTMRSEHTAEGRITLRISNEGVGPARLKTLVVRYRGQPADGLRDLLHRCCGLAAGASWSDLDALGLISESRPVGLYRPGQGADLVVLERNARNAAIWDRLADARLHLEFEACYCSVLGDCWTSNLDPVRDPERVSGCPAIAAGYKE